MRAFIITLVASLALFTGQAHAQRCLPGMQGIEVRANMVDGFTPGGSDGGYIRKEETSGCSAANIS